jgi:tripartite ATP-independent transporter DctP family solute receptor
MMQKLFKSFTVVTCLVLVGMLAFGVDKASSASKAAAKVEKQAPRSVDLNPILANPVTLRLAYGDRSNWPSVEKGPDPEHAFALIFKQLVEEQTNGTVKIQLFPNLQLGGHKQMVEMVQTGTVDICISTGVMGGFYPKFEIIYMPYAFQSEEIAWWVFDNSKFWKNLMADMEKTTGFTFLGIGQNGVRHFTNSKREIRQPSDLKGLKFRVMQSPIYVKTVEAMGGNAVPIAWEELYTALQTGVVDGQENPISVIDLGKLHEVQKYLTLDGHTWSEDLMVMNTAKFNSFPEGVKRVLKMAGYFGAISGRSAEVMRTRVLTLEKVSAKLKIYKPTPAELKQFQDMARPPVITYLKGKIGDKTVDSFLSAVKEAELALGYR